MCPRFFNTANKRKLEYNRSILLVKTNDSFLMNTAKNYAPPDPKKLKMIHPKKSKVIVSQKLNTADRV